LSFIAVCSFVSCSSSEDGGPSTEFPQTEKVIVQAGNQGRVTNYKGTGGSLAPAMSAAQELTMPTQPAIPADAIDMTSGSFQPWAPTGGSNFVVPAGKTFNNQLGYSGYTYYIAGEATFTNVWGSGTIIILPGGKLTYPNIALGYDVKVYNYGGTFVPGSTDFTMSYGSVFMTTEDFISTGKLNISGTLYVEGNLKANTFDINNNAILNVIGNAEFTSAILSNNVTAYFGGSLKADYFELNSGVDVIAACRSEFSDFYLTNNVKFRSEGYVKSPKTKLDSGSTLEITSGSLASLGELNIPNAPSAKISVAGDKYAIVEASNITVNYNDLRNTFTGYMGLHVNQINGDGSLNAIEFQSNVKVNEDDNTYIEETACHPSFGTPTGDDGPVIDHIADVICPDHDHDISSTCVQIAGNKAYVSYHQQGAGYSGCLEVMDFNDTSINLLNWLRSETARDFNHLIIDNNRIYATGGCNAGAFMACVPLENGVFTSGDADAIEVVKLYGADGKTRAHDANCVIRNGNYYTVTTTSGISTVNATELTIADFKATTGTAKHVATDNTGNVVTLNLGDKSTTASPAIINKYSATDYSLANPLLTLNSDIITPVDGKNVCKIDGNNIYVCLGQNGFKRYTNGVENGTFKLEGTKSAVNGMDYDDKYIYIAYGSDGLYILDKNTLNVVASYTHSGGKSANYVTVVNKFIFVAYGREGLQLFKLKD
ncbi:MAG: hypothetical protein ACI4V5_01545, partial [Prevotella sp.]